MKSEHLFGHDDYRCELNYNQISQLRAEYQQGVSIPGYRPYNEPGAVYERIISDESNENLLYFQYLSEKQVIDDTRSFEFAFGRMRSEAITSDEPWHNYLASAFIQSEQGYKLYHQLESPASETITVGYSVEDRLINARRHLLSTVYEKGLLHTLQISHDFQEVISDESFVEYCLGKQPIYESEDLSSRRERGLYVFSFHTPFVEYQLEFPTRLSESKVTELNEFFTSSTPWDYVWKNNDIANIEEVSWLVDIKT